MREIMISIQPQWVEKILNGEKTIEIRKTMPKCELPCKVYIYCTQSKNVKENIWKVIDPLNQVKPFYAFDKFGSHKDVVLNGKVVAEFLLDTIECFTTDYRQNVEQTKRICQQSCVDFTSMSDYEIGSPCLYAWHIRHLNIFDKPKELSDFSGFIPNNKCEKHENGFACDKCDAYDKEHETCLALYYCRKPIKRPPQSWYYVEESL